MRAIGITGSFGTGKTTVAKIFARLGARLIDADRLAHRIIRKGNPEYKRIVHWFGKTVLNRDGEIDRKKLGQAVFKNRLALKKLCRVIHPAVIKEIKREIAKAKSQKQILAIDAPLLIEAGLNRIVDKLIVVSASQGKQLERIKLRTGLTKRKILLRIKAQLPLKKKMQLADFVVDNNGSLTYTKKQIKRIWKEIKREV